MIAEFEDAMIARIKAGQDKKLWPYRLATIESYGGQIDENAQSTFQFPAVFVAFIGWKQERKAGERTRIVRAKFTIYVAARNPRNERATRHGDKHEAGSFQIAEDMIALLENQKLGFPLSQPLEHTEIETLFVARRSDGVNAESILAVPFEMSFGWKAALPECANPSEDDWLTTGQSFYLSPGDDQPDLGAVIQHGQS
ncbi:MAG: hypothetical protein GAK35_03386 [Herbaspirillum frisingense]|uniref:DUF1834 family protein n=1 Tax=Herbaspirillum frisingense TaxID=92645 RepID=A0A7V8JSY1_9BURK|nr:MAG: hypothetical protein GAK35_03386 [Herbaspirillum frisingense]